MNLARYDSIAVAIASHISNPKRISYLVECLLSILASSTSCHHIYLSISFETNELLDLFHEKIDPIHDSRIRLFIRPTKTPQMRHIDCLCETMCQDGIEWVLFCDDDDTYDPDRIQAFQTRIQLCLKEIKDKMSDKRLAGVYESTFGKHHEEHRHEFWCYCVHIDVIRGFYSKLMLSGDVETVNMIIDHQCCDILFAEYLRRLTTDQIHVYSRIVESYYHYRVTENEDSVTGVIKGNQPAVWQPMIVNRAEDIPVYIDLYHAYLSEHLSVYLHDVFLRTVVCMEFDAIIRAELKSDYQYIDHIDAKYMGALLEYHTRIKEVCDKMFIF